MATQEFLDEWRHGRGELSTLARIELPRSNGSQTDYLYVSQREVSTYPGTNTGDPGRLWLSMVKDFMPIHGRGGFATTEIALCTSGMVLYADRPVTFPGSPTVTKTVKQSLSIHDWYAAKVTIWRYLHALRDFDHAQEVFHGDVIDLNVDGDEVTLQLRQRTDWNRPVAPRYVTKREYPRSTDDAVGLPLPSDYGNISGLGLRRPWPSPYGTAYSALEHLRTNKRVVKGLLVDTGRGSGLTNPAARVLVAGHVCTSVVDTTQGTMVFMDRDGMLCLMRAPGGNIINGQTEAGITLPDNMDFAWLGLAPAEVIPVANSAYNPRHALDPSDTTYATLDFAAGYRELRIKLPSIPGPGDLVGWNAVIGYWSSAAFGGCGFTISDDAISTQTNLITPLPVKTTPGEALSATFGTSGWGGFPTPDEPWSFGTNRMLRVYYDPSYGTQGGWCRIFFIGVMVQFKPRQELLQTAKFTGQFRTVPRPRGAGRPFSSHSTYKEPVMEPATTELRGKFYANVKGMKDQDGSYTDTINALIEKLPDIARHVLVARGGQHYHNQVEHGEPYGTPTFGSFIDAREALKDANGRDSLFAFGISEKTDVRTILEWLTSCGCCQIFISPYDDKFKIVVWRPEMPVDYPLTIKRQMIESPTGPTVGRVPKTDLLTSITVAYGRNEFTGGYEHESTLAHDRSIAGYDFRNLRDEYMTVVASESDRLNFTPIGFSAAVALLTPGDYTPQGFCEHLKAQMDSAAPSSRKYMVCHGTTVSSNYNDRVDITNPSALSALVAPGTYATMSSLAAAVQAALVSVDATWTVRYDAPTMKFVVRTTGASRQIPGGTSGTDPVRGRSVWSLLGFSRILGNLSVPANTDVFANDVRLENHISITSLDTRTTYPLQSGSFGSDSATIRHCGDLLGAPVDADIMGDDFTHGSVCFFTPKGNREQLMRDLANLYGARRELNVQGRCIYDTPTARRLRNVLADLFAFPRAPITFSTLYMPDVERGNVFLTDEDVDETGAFSGDRSDGSWGDKKFAVAEFVHHLGPTRLASDIVAVQVGTIEEVLAGWGYGWGYSWGA